MTVGNDSPSAATRAKGGYLVPAPDPQARVRWADTFGTRFTIFVDTEEEFDWNAPLRRDARGTRAIAALPEMHRRFAERAVAVTYLVDHPVVQSCEAVETLHGLLEDGRSAIGAQLHPWVTPPFEEDINVFNSFAGNLPVALERAKLRELTETIKAAFGSHPIVYRAGRYGLGPHTLSLLAELGYRVDSSMRATYDYSDQAGPDFGAIDSHAFYTRPQASLLELPLTTIFIGSARRGGVTLDRALGKIPRARGVAARLGLLSRVALTPEDMPFREAAEAVRIAIGEGVRLLNFSFHSPSVEPGHTPYVRDAADLAVFHRWWDDMLALLDRLGVRSASIAEILAAAR